MALSTVLWIVLLLIFLLIAYVITKLLLDDHYFRSQGVLHIRSNLFQVFYALIWKKKGVIEITQDHYDIMRKANVTISGRMEMGLVNYMITDLDILKHIFVKDFDKFASRREFSVPKSDLLVRKMLIFVPQEEWKALRAKMSPTFTTGKIKRLFSLFNNSSKKLVTYVEDRMEASPTGEIDLWEGYSKFTMDTIASAVCGMDSKAFDQVGLFEKMGKQLQFSFNPGQFLYFLILMMLPKVAGLFKMTLFGSEMYEFFSGAIKASIKQRQKNGEKRNDFIQLMLEAREDKLKVDEGELDKFEKDAIIKEEGTKTATSTLTSQILDDDGIVSQCVLFILAGFDTTQSLLLFTAYALAIHPDIQDRLRTEVDEALEENGGEFTYESVHKMQYLDMVINETLRFYPPAPFTDRGCTQDYTFPGTNISVKKRNGILIPIMGIHHDEKYYPEPSKFDPLRFSPQRKGDIHPYAFLPFGQGPRNCIGMRFALTEVKLAIAHLVHNFDIVPSKKTLIPMVFQNAGSLKPKDGMWLALNKRLDK